MDELIFWLFFLIISPFIFNFCLTLFLWGRSKKHVNEIESLWKSKTNDRRFFEQQLSIFRKELQAIKSNSSSQSPEDNQQNQLIKPNIPASILAENDKIKSEPTPQLNHDIQPEKIEIETLTKVELNIPEKFVEDSLLHLKVKQEHQEQQEQQEHQEQQEQQEHQEHQFINIAEINKDTNIRDDIKQHKNMNNNVASNGFDLDTFIKEHFNSQNTIVYAGIAILLFGFIFLLKYAIDRDMLSPQIRLVASALGGVTLLGFGFKVLAKKRHFALILQGGGIAVLYLTLVASFQLYHIFSSPTTFVLLLICSAFATFLSIKQNAQSLAILGFISGYLAPLLLSTGNDHHIFLFTYYSILTTALFACSWFTSWRILNTIGFVISTFVSIMWFNSRYQSDFYIESQIYFTFNFLLFLAISALFSIRKDSILFKKQLKNPEDSLETDDDEQSSIQQTLDFALLLINPFIAFILQYSLMRSINFTYGAGISAFLYGLLYLLVAKMIWSHFKQYQYKLSQFFLAQGFLFSTLAIPLAFDAKSTSALWAIQSLLVLWIFFKKDKITKVSAKTKLIASISVFLLHLMSIISFIFSPNLEGRWSFINGTYINVLIIAVTLIASAALIRKKDSPLKNEENDTSLSPFVLIYGQFWWYAGAVYQIFERTSDLSDSTRMKICFVFTLFSSLIFKWISHKLKWRELRFSTWILAPMIFITSFSCYVIEGYSHFSLTFLPTFIISVLYLYWDWYRFEKQSEEKSFVLSLLHAVTALFLFFFIYYEYFQRIEHYYQDNNASWYYLFAILPAICISELMIRIKKWPFISLYTTSVRITIWPILLFFGIFSFTSLTFAMQTNPLPWLPIFNPVTPILIFLFWHIKRMLNNYYEIISEIRDEKISNSLYYFINLKEFNRNFWTAFTFIWMNFLILQAAHHWGGLTYSLKAFVQSFALQTTLSILWSMWGIFLMHYSTKNNTRKVWLIGATLMGTIALKLFMIDLSGTNSIARIVSFLAVGVIFLVIGYFYPIPKENRNNDSGENNKEENQS